MSHHLSLGSRLTESTRHLLFSQPHIITMIRSELPPRFPRRTDVELLFD